MKKKKIVICIAFALCIIFIITMIVCLSVKGDTVYTDFTPPKEETNFKTGTPNIDNESWIKLYTEGMTFSAHILGEIRIRDGLADIFFTNDKSNDVLLKLRILDKSNNILAESGLIKPNQYIESIEFRSILKVGEKIVLKIMAYEPNTYHGKGSVELNTEIFE